MSNISDLVADLEGRGHALSAVPDGRLAVADASTLTDDDRRTIRTRKAGLVAWLKPSPNFGAQAEADARTLAILIDTDPSIDLDDLRDQAQAQGVYGDRFAFGLVALPDRLDQAGRGTG